MSSIRPTTDPPVADWPLFWFARLEKAVQLGDHQAAAYAHKQLTRLGVQVSYGQPTQTNLTPPLAGVSHVG